ncbi:ABC transporter ATP-binding protein [Terriglobus saanensis]|uniref:ABC transporter related protein n=1 Tax=Terriglobus saanensis (strain ATCC BAA-1853 / DSM 23119 / SP1PR4) TaxID=401053 RepID=E8V3F7_TERSS|nr:ABC transporter ATP-binding protein [Terriglobus saanensis]ADV83570.1 ABC transporter related protein [Terriglobus saanensis SP1PR4]
MNETTTGPPHLLEVENLCIETAPRHGNPRSLLEDLSFHMVPNEFLAIVGESGSGKTMAARAILGLLPPGVRLAAGAIRLGGRDLTQLTLPQLRAVRGSQIGMVFQEPMVSLNPALTVGHQLAEGLKLHRGLGAEETRELCVKMLSRVRITDPERCLKSFPHEFSGGMRQRIMLASVLLLKPKLLIADEPTTALDTLSQREILELMVELARDNGVATLLITHDLGLVSRYSERVIVLEKGKLIESGDTSQVLTQPAHSYTRRLVCSRPQRSQNKQAPAPDREVLLQIDQACISYPGRPGLFGPSAVKPIVHNIDLTLREGEIMALVGASGSGKTTLGRAVMGLKGLDSGAIRFDGKDIAKLSRKEMRTFRAQAQLIFQDPFSSLDPRMRIDDIIAEPLRHAPGTTAEHFRRVQEVLSEVGLTDFGNRYPHEMSGGQRQRVAIARAIVSRPRLVVADEPVSALDMTIQAQVLALLQRLQADYGFACLFITHDLSVVEQVANRVIVMSNGRIVESGLADEVLRNPQHGYTRALLAATPSLPQLTYTEISLP